MHRYRERVEVRAFDLADRTWRAALPSPLRGVLASLVVHHLPAAGQLGVDPCMHIPCATIGLVPALIVMLKLTMMLTPGAGSVGLAGGGGRITGDA